MLDSIFIIIILMAFVLFLLGIIEENIIFSGSSILMWIIVMAGHLYIEVPGDTSYTENALLPVSIGFIFINIIWILILFFDLKERRKLP